MNLQATRTDLSGIRPLRTVFLREINAQVRYHACHERGWSNSYLLKVGDEEVGYGAVKGKDRLADRDAVFEFFVLPPYRKLISPLFTSLLTASGAHFIECQSNDFLLSSMLYEFALDINADVMLFDDHIPTDYQVRDIIFRSRRKEDLIFEHEHEEPGEYVLEKNGEVVATGGFTTYYNPPFADLFMEVRQDNRRQGLGSYLIQELKKACYQAGRIPAARCAIRNEASRATLLKSGMKACGFMLSGALQPLAFPKKNDKNELRS